MVACVKLALTAARDHDVGAFDISLTALSKLDREQLSLLLGTVVQMLLEQRHPDGLDSDDVDQLIDATLTSAAWYPRTDRDHLVRVILGALGVTVIEDQPLVDGMAIIGHSLLLLGDQPTAVVRPLIDHGVSELHRAQTQEMP